MASLTMENRALQDALERLRMDLEEERTMRVGSTAGGGGDGGGGGGSKVGSGALSILGMISGGGGGGGAGGVKGKLGFGGRPPPLTSKVKVVSPQRSASVKVVRGIYQAAARPFARYFVGGLREAPLSIFRRRPLARLGRRLGWGLGVVVGREVRLGLEGEGARVGGEGGVGGGVCCARSKKGVKF